MRIERNYIHIAECSTNKLAHLDRHPDACHMSLLPDTQHCRLRMRRAEMHVGIANPRWRGRHSRHSRRMRNPQFYVSGKRFMLESDQTTLQLSILISWLDNIWWQCISPLNSWTEIQYIPVCVLRLNVNSLTLDISTLWHMNISQL